MERFEAKRVCSWIKLCELCIIIIKYYEQSVNRAGGSFRIRELHGWSSVTLMKASWLVSLVISTPEDNYWFCVISRQICEMVYRTSVKVRIIKGIVNVFSTYSTNLSFLSLEKHVWAFLPSTERDAKKGTSATKCVSSLELKNLCVCEFK